MKTPKSHKNPFAAQVYDEIALYLDKKSRHVMIFQDLVGRHFKTFLFNKNLDFRWLMLFCLKSIVLP